MNELHQTGLDRRPDLGDDNGLVDFIVIVLRGMVRDCEDWPS